MFQFVVAASIALGSESVDGVFAKRQSSCSGGSCSVLSKPVVEAKKVEAVKPAATVKESTSACKASCGKHTRKLFGRVSGLRAKCS